MREQRRKSPSWTIATLVFAWETRCGSVVTYFALPLVLLVAEKREDPLGIKAAMDLSQLRGGGVAHFL